MPNILVVGAASGIGKAFVRLYLLSPDNHIIAADLAFGNFLSSALKDDYRGDVCSNAKGELSLVYPFDISRQRDCYGLAIRVEDLDVIVHSAGIRGQEASSQIYLLVRALTLRKQRPRM